jgi:dimethylaniline monooxygenase (N-oxide forming)
MVVHPDFEGLYFIGLVQPWGSIMPLSELQSRWIAELLAGRTSLPDQAMMHRDIARSRNSMRNSYTTSPRHTIQVDYYAYVDALQRERRRPPRPLQPVSSMNNSASVRRKAA